MSSIKVPHGTRLVVMGDVHEHEDQFNELIEEIKPDTNTLLASVGDVYNKGFGVSAAENITNTLIKLFNKGVGFAVRGNNELKNIRKIKRNNKELSDELKWWNSMPLSLSFVFDNNSRLTVIHGGVAPYHTWNDLLEEIDICYIRKIDESGKPILIKRAGSDKGSFTKKVGGKLWHELYDGRFGYIVSGHDAQKDGEPKFYNYSCNLDSSIYTSGKLTAQEFINGNKGELITITGKAKHSSLTEMQGIKHAV